MPRDLTDQWSCYTCGYLGFCGECEDGEPCCPECGTIDGDGFGMAENDPHYRDESDYRLPGDGTMFEHFYHPI